MKKILIIDDSIFSRSLLKEMLEGSRYVVYESKDGLEGLETIQVINPDVVITDIFMPEMDGIEIISAIRKKYSHIKIITISGSEQSEAMYFKICSMIGSNFCMKKPVDKNKLLEILEQL